MDYNKLVEIDPKNEGAFYNRANIYFESKKYELAIANCFHLSVASCRYGLQQ